MSHHALLRSAIVLVLVGVAMAAVFFFRSRTTAPPVWDRPVVTHGRPTAPVDLYFGDTGDYALVAEPREVVRDADREEFLSRLVVELLRGSYRGNRSLFFDGAGVRGVFAGEEGDLVVDFQGSPFASDASAATCYLAVMSLLNVIREAAPEVRTVTLLANGVPLSRVERRLAVWDRLPLRAMIEEFETASAES